MLSQSKQNVSLILTIDIAWKRMETSIQMEKTAHENSSVQSSPIRNIHDNKTDKQVTTWKKKSWTDPGPSNKYWPLPADTINGQ